MKARYWYVLFLVIIYSKGYGQEANYANYEVGSKATMLGGAVVAGIDNISSAYYNPGALSFIDNSSVSLETSTLFAGVLQIRNGAGDQIDIESSFFDIVPSMIGGIVKSQKIPDWTFAYSVFTMNSSLIEFNVRQLAPSNVIPSFTGQEYYDGAYDYHNRINENWIGVSAGRVIGERFGIGATIFAANFYQDFNRNQLAVVTGNVDGVASTLASSSINQYMRFRSLAAIFKIGLNYVHNRQRIGFTVTTPKINLDIISKGAISQNINVFDPLVSGMSNSIVFYGDDITTYHRTPLKLAFGYQYKFTSSLISFSLTYNSPVAEYAMLTSQEVVVPEVGVLRPSISAYDKANQVFNFSVGYRNDVREGLSILLGAKSDFNYVDDEFLNQSAFIPKMSYWDLYHLTGGVIWYNDRANLTLGADYAFGLSKDDLQQVNLSDPVASEIYFGERTRDTRTFHNQVYIVIGFMFNFL